MGEGTQRGGHRAGARGNQERGDRQGPQATPDDAAFADGLALVRDRSDNHGYINRDGELVIPLQYAAARAFSGGRAAIKISDRWGYIDTDQGTAISPQFISASGFGDDLAPVRKDGNLWGYIDGSGRIRISPQYEEAEPFYEGRAAVMLDGKWGYIDTQGALISPAQFDEAEPFFNGAARVRLNVGEHRKYGYLDPFGNFLWYPTD